MGRVRGGLFPRFLANENIPRSTLDALRSAGHGVATLVELGAQGCPDEELVAAAARRGGTVLTLALDFGRIFVERELAVQILVRRCRSRRASALNPLLLDFLKRVDLDETRFRHCLVVLDERGYRVRARR